MIKTAPLLFSRFIFSCTDHGAEQIIFGFTKAHPDCIHKLQQLPGTQQHARLPGITQTLPPQGKTKIEGK